MTKRFFKMLVCLIALTAVSLGAVACDLAKGGSSASSGSQNSSGSSSSSGDSSDNSGSSGNFGSSDSSGEVHEHKFKIVKDEKTDNTLCIVSYECECGKQSDDKIEVIIVRYVKSEDSQAAVKAEERCEPGGDGKVRILKKSLYSSDVEKAYAVKAGDEDKKSIGLISGWSDFY